MITEKSSWLFEWARRCWGTRQLPYFLESIAGRHISMLVLSILTVTLKWSEAEWISCCLSFVCVAGRDLSLSLVSSPLSGRFQRTLCKPTLFDFLMASSATTTRVVNSSATGAPTLALERRIPRNEQC